MGKHKILIIAVAVVLAISVLIGVVAAIAISNSYLKSMKGYDFAESITFNGVEIVEDDGLFYLTREGKKISKTGYEMLVSVDEKNPKDYDDDMETLVFEKGFEIFGYYVARKPDVKNLFIVNAEGVEYKLENENLVYTRTALPFLIFADSVTMDQCVISLKELNSDLSAATETAITAHKQYDRIEPYKLDDDKYLYDYAMLVDGNEAAGSPAYSYVNGKGATICTSYEQQAAVYNLEAPDGTVDAFFQLSDKTLVAFDGAVLATEILAVEEDDNVLIATCGNVLDLSSMRYAIITAKVRLTVNETEYDTDSATTVGSLLSIKAKNSNETKTYNLFTGEISTLYQDLDFADTHYYGDNNSLILARARLVEDPSTYVYLDAVSGLELCRSTHGDMGFFTGGILESIEDPTTEDGKRKLHFVSGGKPEVVLGVDFDTTVAAVEVNDKLSAYTFTTVSIDATTSQSITKTALYLPFVGGATMTAAYDTFEVLDVFANAAPVALARDFDAGKIDLIDVATGKVVKSIAAAGAMMAKISISHVETLAVVVDTTVVEGAVNVAMFDVTTNDDNGDAVSKEAIALYRPETQKKLDSGYSVAELSAVTLSESSVSGRSVVSSNKREDSYDSFSKYVAVRHGNMTSSVFTFNESLQLTKISDIPYVVKAVQSYDGIPGNEYVVITNDSYNEGLYTVDGKQILAPVYDDVDVCTEKYIIACKKGAAGMYEFKAKSEKTKLVLDFEYDDIDHIFGDLFIVTEGEDRYVYEGASRVKKDKIVGDTTRGVNYTFNKETGKMQYNEYFVVNLDGKLYIHREELKDMPVTEIFVADVVGKAYIKPCDVLAVNFRNADGSLVETKVIYPTLLSRATFEMPEGEWHTTAIKDLQSSSTVYTRNSLMETYSNGVIDLYKSHT